MVILVGGLKCRTQFWKGTTQRSSQQSLVEIGSVVSEEKISFKFHPPFFLFLAWRPSWSEFGITGHSFGRGPPKDHSTKGWLQLAQWFLRRRLKCEMLTDGRWTKSDGNSSHGLKTRWAKKGALDSQLQVIKFTSYLPMVGGSLRVLLLLPPLKLVAMI